MEDLLRGLRNLGLQPPTPDQLWQLLDDDAEVQERLVKLLAFNVVSEGEGEEGAGGDTGFAAALMGQDLLQEAVNALLDNFRRFIDRQRQNHRKEGEALQSGSTKKVKLPPRKALHARFDAALRRDEEDRRACAGFRPRLVYDGLTSHHSKHSDRDTLKPICIAELNEAPKRYEGSYLLCKVVTPLLLYVGVTFLAEDTAGSLIPVSISHFTDNINAETIHISKYLPKGTRLIIKEPYLSLDHQARAGPCSGRADVGIRVDSPTDVVVLQEDDEILSEVRWAEEDDGELGTCNRLSWLRDDGNSCNVEEAYRLYDEGRLGAALRIARLDKDANREKHTLLMARILFGLGAWNEAHDLFLRLKNTDVDGEVQDEGRAKDFAIKIGKLTPAQAAIRCRLRAAQETQGLSVNDVKSIYFASSTVARFDTADFVGPVDVKAIEDEGRGLVTTRDVEPGEQLLCCRAVSGAYPNDEQSIGSPLLRLNLDNGVVSATTQVRAQTRLIHAIVDRPELALPVLGLTAGPDMPYSRFVEEPYPLRTKGNADYTFKRHVDAVDAAYVDGVLRFNAFGPAQSPARRSDTDDAVDLGGELSKSTMPHPLPAILNHACLPNVASIFFSDIVTTRALMHLPKGTQIVHQYVRGEEPYAIRAAQLSKHGFECACQLCKLDRRDGKEALDMRARIIQGELRAVEERSRVLLKRVNISRLGSKDALSAVSGADDSPDEDVEAHRDLLTSLAHLLDRVNKTYASDRGTLRPDAFVVLEIMVPHLALLDYDQAADAVEQAVLAVGGQLDLADRTVERPGQGYLAQLPRLHIDRVIGLLLLLAVISMNLGRATKAQKLVQSAYWSHQCMIGGGLAVFRDRWLTKDYEKVVQEFAPV